MVEIRLNSALKTRATWHAYGAKESTSDIVEAAISRFIEEPRLTVPDETKRDRPPRHFLDTPYLTGPREKVTLNADLLENAKLCAKSLDISLDQLADFAVANDCAPVNEPELEWRTRADAG